MSRVRKTIAVLPGDGVGAACDFCWRGGVRPTSGIGSSGRRLASREPQRTRYVDCSGFGVPYYRDFVADVRDRGGRTMEDGRVFAASRLALRCQAGADIFRP